MRELSRLSSFGLGASAFATALLLQFGSAHAQDEQMEPEPEPEEPAVTDEELGGDLFEEGGGLSGSEENPDAPNSEFDSTDEETKEEGGDVLTAYPTQVIYRPLTLPEGMSQIRATLPLNFDPFGVALAVEGDYGVTREIQVGLRYGLGRYSEEFSVGKAVAIDAAYLFTNDISAEISLPLYLDPFAMGLSLGVPMRFEFFDKFALTFGKELVNFRLVEFFPSVANATQNDAFILANESNTVLPLWIVNLTGGAVYQLDDNMALDVQLGTQFDDESTTAARTLLNLGLLYAKTNKLDFGARVGSNDLSQFSETLTLTLFGNVRI